MKHWQTKTSLKSMFPLSHGLFILGLMFLGITLQASEVDNFSERDQRIQDADLILDAEVNRRFKLAQDNANLLSKKENKFCDKEILKEAVWGQVGGSELGGLIGSLENFSQENPRIQRMGPYSMDQSIYKGTAANSARSMAWWFGVLRSVQTMGKSAFFTLKQKGHEKFPNVIAEVDPLTVCEVPAELKNNFKDLMEKQKEAISNYRSRTKNWNPLTDKASDENILEFQSKYIEPEIAKIYMPCLNTFLVSSILEKKFENRKNAEKTNPPQAVQRHPGGLESSIKINGHIVGVDKLGHFMDQGAEEYKAAYIDNKGVPGALELGKKLEEGRFGLLTTKIKSYADMSANYSGMKFWHELLNTETYFKCVNGQFEVNKPFLWSRYVNDSWDEGINCSQYEDVKMDQQIQRNLKKLNLTCPVDNDACKKMALEIAPMAREQIVSPACLEQIHSSSQPNSSDVQQPKSGVR